MSQLRDNSRHDVADSFVSNGPHLVVRSILNRMLDIDGIRNRAQRLRLRIGAVDKLNRRDEDTWDAAIF